MGYPPDEIRGSHPVFGQWASKYQERTNQSNVHSRAENFSKSHIIHVLRQNYWTFMRFVDFLSFQLISLIRWNLSIDWWKVLCPFRQPRHHSLIRWISTGYQPGGFIVFGPRKLHFSAPIGAIVKIWPMWMLSLMMTRWSFCSFSRLSPSLGNVSSCN